MLAPLFQIFLSLLSINIVYPLNFNSFFIMRVIVNVRSTFISNKERLDGAKHNSRVFTAEELLSNYLDALQFGDIEVSSIYRTAILNRMKDADILYPLLDNIDALEGE